jgi:hypothetical protein
MSLAAALKHFVIRHDLIPDRLLEARLNKEMQSWGARGKTPPAPSLLKQRIVLDYASRFKPRTLVETGTYYGNMISACKGAFERIYSIELGESFYARARKRFAGDPRIAILQGDSGEQLAVVLKEVKGGCLFWLDAHYSGGLTAKGSVETPIERELGLIFAHPFRDHIILIDDAHCFDGTHDYPVLDVVTQRARSRGWSSEVRDNVIRLIGPSSIIAPFAGSIGSSTRHTGSDWEEGSHS